MKKYQIAMALCLVLLIGLSAFVHAKTLSTSTRVSTPPSGGSPLYLVPPPASPLNVQLMDPVSPFALAPIIIPDVKETVTGFDTQALDSFMMQDVSGNVDVNTYLRFVDVGSNPFQSEGQVFFGENNQGMLSDYLYFEDGRTMYEYQLEFANGFLSVVDPTTSDLVQFETETLDPVLGESFTVAEAERISGNRTGVHLTLVASDYMITANEGATVHTSVNGRAVTVEVLDVDPAGFDGRARLAINGMSLAYLEEGEFAFAPGLWPITVVDVIGGSPEQVVLALDATVVDFVDRDANDNMFDAGVIVNGEYIEDGFVNIRGLDLAPQYELQSIQYRLETDAPMGDVYIAEGDVLSQELDEPEGMLHDAWNIFYGGLENRTLDPLLLDAGGDDEYSLRFTNTEGIQYRVPLLDNSNDDMLGFHLGTSSEALKFVEPADRCAFRDGINQSDYFIVTNDNAPTGITRAYQYDGVNTTSREISFTDLGLGPLQITYSAPSALCGAGSMIGQGVLVAGGNTYDVFVNEATGMITIDLNGDSAFTTSEANIVVQYGQVVDINPALTDDLNQQEPYINSDFSVSITTAASFRSYAQPDEIIEFEVQAAPGNEVDAALLVGPRMYTNPAGNLEGMTSYGVRVEQHGGLMMGSTSTEFAFSIPDREQHAEVWVIFDDARQCGDINNDGNVDVLDAKIAAESGAGLVQLGGPDFACGDVQQSGIVDIVDALAIAQHSVGTPVTLSCSAACA